MTTDELRAKFEAYRKFMESRGYCWSETEWASRFDTYQAAHASRDAEVEALRKDAERYRRAVMREE